MVKAPESHVGPHDRARIRLCMDEVRRHARFDQPYRDEDPIGSLVEGYRNAACVIQLHRLERGQHSPAREDGPGAAPCEPLSSNPPVTACAAKGHPAGGDLYVPMRSEADVLSPRLGPDHDGTCWDGVDPDAARAVGRLQTAMLIAAGCAVLLFWLDVLGVL